VTKNVRITAIDIGTNTVLMLIADLGDDGRIKTIRDEIAFPRLGKGVDEMRHISPESITRVLNVLKDYKRASETSGSEKIIACGTSALRESKNRNEVIKRIRQEASLDVEVLSGEEEAEWTFLGALSGLPRSRKHFVVIDIGGGSTEITLGTQDHVEKRVSLDLGCVQLTERFLQSTPPTSKELQRAMVAARAALSGLGGIDSSRHQLVGVAGTVTTLAALDQNLSTFDPDKVDGYVLHIDSIQSIFEDLSQRSLDEIQSSPVVPTGRADILLAGVLILIEFMAIHRFERITVSKRGLRYGLVLREFERLKTIRKKG
jgi:exopolyphosphatase/guanosine-5'-triphosphate,3'-diphosphate pyrophosphatase